MTERTMRALLRSAVVCAPLLGLLPSLAAAQTSSAIDINLIVKRNGKEVDNGTAVYADINDCGGDPVTGDGSTFTFSVNYPGNPAVVELWLGVEQDCSQPSARINQTATGLQPLCRRLDVDTSGSKSPVLTVSGKSLFQRQNSIEAARCDEVHGATKYTVYMLPVSAETTATDAKMVVPVGTVGALKAVFTPYTKRPEPPTGLSGRNGESRLEVDFKAPASSVTLTKYRAYFDTNPGSCTGFDAPSEDAGISSGLDGGSLDAGTADSGAGAISSDASAAACSTGALVANCVAPVNAAGVIRTGESNSKTVRLTDLTNVDLDQSVAVAVVAIDPAGNESRLSTPVCVTRKQTNGFIDTCRVNEENCGLESCSLDPTNKGSAISMALLALALAALIRRRGRA